MLVREVQSWRVFGGPCSIIPHMRLPLPTYSLVHPWSHVLRIGKRRNFHLTLIPRVGIDYGILMCFVLRVLLVSLVLLDELVLLGPL